MSTEDTQKWYECPTCGKLFPKQESFAAHMKTHPKSDNSISRDDLKDMIKSAIAEALASNTTAQSAPPASSATPPATSFVSTPTTPPPARFGQFVVKPKPQTQTFDIFCPYCGTAEIDRPMPVVEKEKVVTQEVEFIPKGYIKAPQGGEDWLRILDLRHLDGKPIDQCPDCAKSLLTWFNQHKANLERASRGQ